LLSVGLGVSARITSNWFARDFARPARRPIAGEGERDGAQWPARLADPLETGQPLGRVCKPRQAKTDVDGAGKFDAPI
jgi:hypothetical protein